MLDSPLVRYRVIATLILVFCVIWFSNLGYRSLALTDEGRYAEIAREMAVTGDWTTPRLNGIKYFEKPPLQYWMTAAAYKAFGEHEWTARLWAALTGLAGVLLTGFAGGRLFGRRTGFLAAAVLAGSVLYAAIGHMNTLDMGVTFCMTLGLFGFLLAQQSEHGTRESRMWMWLAWAAMGLAFLSKGLIGLVLPGAAMAAYALIQRDLSFLKRLDPIAGIAVMLAIALPWVLAVSIANPEFAHFFFIHEHFHRFLTQVHHRTAPWWYFVPILVAGMLPWTPMLGQALVTGWKGDSSGSAFKLRRFLLIYAGVIFLFFSTSQSKLPSYILPILPALALLVGEWLGRVRGRKLVWLIAPVAVLALATAIASPFAAHLASEKVSSDLYGIFSRWIIAGTLTLLSASCLAMVFAWRERIEAAVVALGVGGLLLVQLVMTGHEALSSSYSTAHLAGTIRPLLEADTPFYSVRIYEHTLPFYIKRTVTLVDYRHRDELKFGLQQEPHLEPTAHSRMARHLKKAKPALRRMQPLMD